MHVKPIKNKEDHLEATSRMKDLLLSGSTEDTLDEIEVLAAVIEKYEREAFVIQAPDPITAIRFRMNQKGLVNKDLEPFIGSRSRVSEILSRKRNLSIDMMRALHSGLGIPYESLMQRELPDTSDEIEVSQPVLKKLNELGFKLKTESILEFLRDAFGANYSPALQRKTRTQRASGKTDESALLLWQAAVLKKAKNIEVKGQFSAKQINKKFLRSIALLSSEKKGPLNAVNELSKVGVRLVIVPVLPGTYLDGAVMLLDGKAPVIGLTLRHDRIDNFWFTLLHELSHLAKHLDVLKNNGGAIFDELDIESDDTIETEADNLAKLSLLPSKYASRVTKKYASTEEILKISSSAGVHVSIAAGRWQKENGDYKKFSRLIERNTVRKMLESL